MLRTLWTSKSAMNANQERLDSISNNIANSGTMGYKKTKVGFQDLLTESLDRKGYPINDKESYIGTGMKAGEWYRDNSQGGLIETLRSTDIAIDGSGYFRVVSSNGESAYTRDGAFAVDGLGRLVDTNGNKLHLEYTNGFTENNVEFTKDNFLIDSEGSVYINKNNNFSKVAEVPLYTAVGDRAFLSVGENLFRPVQGTQVFRTRDADIFQGFMEGSNVDIAEEFADMIITQRGFQLSSKGITTADEMWGMINNLRS